MVLSNFFALFLNENNYDIVRNSFESLNIWFNLKINYMYLVIALDVKITSC